MRGAGLVGLLICVFIVLYLWSNYTVQTAPAMKKATNNANQLAGRSNDAGIGQKGTPVLQDSKFTPVERNGKLVALTVVAMPATNGLAEYFGLAPNDIILEIGPWKVGDDTTMGDFESARDWVQEGMQRQMNMVVDRGGKRLTLPADRNLIPPVMAAPAGAQPPTSPTPAAQ